MLFTQIEFLFFMTAVSVLVLAVRSNVIRKWGLLIGSYYFYAYWDWRFAVLMFLCTFGNWFAAGKILQSGSEMRKKVYFVATLIGSLGVLAYFKYMNFFIDSWNMTMGQYLRVPLLSIILPVGISFYTFQTLSYTIDIFKGEMKERHSLLDVLVFISFFPQLVAGPIVRAADFLPQLEKARELSWDRVAEGSRQYVFGFFKKVFIADRLCLYVDGVFENAQLMDSMSIWFAAIAYGIQIYCDFSGYSDMAIGIARGLGYDFISNFEHPYCSRSITEFWRRWHISLSTFLRDYLYIPLGGNRKGLLRTYINLLVTMVLGGLWHGANWTFVAWGGLHGWALAADKFRFSLEQQSKAKSGIRVSLRLFAGWVVTTLIVLVGWVLFRAQSFPTAFTMIRKMFFLEGGLHWVHPFVYVALLATIVGHLTAEISLLRRFRTCDIRTVYGASALLSLFLVALIYRPLGFQPFIYFQF